MENKYHTQYFYFTNASMLSYTDTDHNTFWCLFEKLCERNAFNSNLCGKVTNLPRTS